MEVKAIGKYIRVQPRKVRIVADKVRGAPALRSATILRFHPSKAAQALRKVLDSAIANAENNHGLSPESLRITEILVDEGPRLKRIRPRAMGRAFRIIKKTSHITVVVDELAVVVRPRATATKAKSRPSFEERKGKRKGKAKAEEAVETVEAAASVEGEAAAIDQADQADQTDQTNETAAAPEAESATKEAAKPKKGTKKKGEG
jgi:large subunit ribosomal protein L22